LEQNEGGAGRRLAGVVRDRPEAAGQDRGSGLSFEREQVGPQVGVQAREHELTIERAFLRCQSSSVSRGTERGRSIVLSRLLSHSEVVDSAQGRMLRTPGISRKDQHQPAGPNQALTDAEPFTRRKCRARGSDIKAAGSRASARPRKTAVLSNRDSRTAVAQKCHALCPRLDHRESGVRPQDRKRHSWKTATSTNVDN